MNSVKKLSPFHGYKGFILCLLFAFFPGYVITSLTGQCISTGPLSLPDDGIASVQFIISGLLDNDLASPTQGICGINLDFMHEHLGDLTITLISPSGTSIELIGPVTTTLFTNLSRWNIRFVPCMTMPLPDAGFTPVWSNNQAWQAFTPYSGSYHPQSGCLEDFNSGPANGVWQLIIEDHDIFQIGTLASATIIFCNPAGLQCAECNPNGGTLSPTAITRCIGQNILSSEIMVDFGGNPPLPSSYSYQFLMTMGNTIVRSGSFFSDTPPPGNYSICGLSYLTVDSMEVNNLLAAGDYNQLIQALTVGTICADISSPCVSLHVLPVPDTTDININLCLGDTFSFGGENYILMGTYYQTHDGPGVCDSVFQIRIFTSELDIDISIPDSLNCGNGAVMVNSSVSGNTGPVTYGWSTLIGSITGPSDLASITVDQPGQYFLSVSDAICNKVEGITVFADQGFPQVFVEGGQITCTNPSVTLDPIYIPTNATLLWTGPMGFVSNQPEISVSVPDVYLLTVTNQTGCSTTRPVTVTIDTSTVDFQIVSLGKNCQDGYIILGSSFEAVVGWDWRGPNNFISDYWRPSISIPGNYTLTTTFINGCEHTENYFFDGDFSIPDIMVSPRDTLHCNEMISLSVSSSTPGITYAWSGPGGFSNNLQSIQITQAGNYSAVVNAPNGCNAQEEVTIDLGDDIFDYQIITDTLNCANDTIEIGVISPEADLYKWIGFSGPDSLNPFITITSAGIYAVMMTDTNSGCQIVLDVLVASDFTSPSFGYTTDTITCDHPIAQLTFVPFQQFTYTNVFWELPDQTIVPGPVLMSSLPGEHRLISIGANGCTGIWLIHIPFDTIRPSLFMETETLGCDDTIDIVTLSLDSLSGYQWSGPGIVSTGVDYISVNEPGIYHLTATGLNGCSSYFDILVNSNFSIPTYDLTFDSLRCDSPATLEANSPETLVEYLWMDSSGDLISDDSIVQVNSPGFYTIEIRGVNNCKAIDTVFIQPLQYPSFNIVSDTITCVNTLVFIQAISTTNPVTYQWSDINGNLISMSDQIEVSQVGPYILSVTGQNACETLDTILIPVDTVPPVAILELLGEVRCQLRDIMFDGSASSPDDIEFLWTTKGGTIQGDNTLSVIEARDTGLYILTVLRPDNGCSNRDSFHLTEYPDAISLAFLEIKPPACSGDSNASIHILGLQGGIQPLLFQLDGGVPQSGDLFGGLKPGNYLLQILDASGCLFDTIVTIEPTNPYRVDAGPDQEILLGESTIVSGTNDLLPIQILNQEWDSLGFVLCQDCPEFRVSPLMTSIYRYSVISTTGCILEDEVIIYVIEKGKYFIGNIFSPNGDNINDEVRLHVSPGIVKVLKWVIFDRWGNAVFGRSDFDPNDTFVSWDGRTALGGELNPGVFPYLLEVELLNGAIEIYHGDITLLR